MSEEIVALEYREKDFSSTQALARRVASVADACAEAGLFGLGMAGWFRGHVAPLVDTPGRALVFGLRTSSVQAAFVVADVLSSRGFSGIYTWSDDVDDEARKLSPLVLAGMGMVRACGGGQSLYGASPRQVRKVLDSCSPAHAAIWMPAPDRFGRAVDGVFLEEAARREIDLVWVPGDGVNQVDAGSEHVSRPQVLRARVDAGEHSAQLLARWATGDRLGRGKLRVADLANTPRRWLREVVGWR